MTTKIRNTFATLTVLSLLIYVPQSNAGFFKSAAKTALGVAAGIGLYEGGKAAYKWAKEKITGEAQPSYGRGGGGGGGGSVSINFINPIDHALHKKVDGLRDEMSGIREDLREIKTSISHVSTKIDKLPDRNFDGPTIQMLEEFYRWEEYGPLLKISFKATSTHRYVHENGLLAFRDKIEDTLSLRARELSYAGVLAKELIGVDLTDVSDFSHMRDPRMLMIVQNIPGIRLGAEENKIIANYEHKENFDLFLRKVRKQFEENENTDYFLALTPDGGQISDKSGVLADGIGPENIEILSGILRNDEAILNAMNTERMPEIYESCNNDGIFSRHGYSRIDEAQVYGATKSELEALVAKRQEDLKDLGLQVENGGSKKLIERKDSWNTRLGEIHQILQEQAKHVASRVESAQLSRDIGKVSADDITFDVFAKVTVSDDGKTYTPKSGKNIKVFAKIGGKTVHLATLRDKSTMPFGPSLRNPIKQNVADQINARLKFEIATLRDGQKTLAQMVRSSLDDKSISYYEGRHISLYSRQFQSSLTSLPILPFEDAPLVDLDLSEGFELTLFNNTGAFEHLIIADNIPEEYIDDILSPANVFSQDEFKSFYEYKELKDKLSIADWSIENSLHDLKRGMQNNSKEIEAIACLREGMDKLTHPHIFYGELLTAGSTKKMRQDNGKATN